MGAGKVYLDVILQNIGIYPSKDLPVNIEENHVFIDNKKSIVVSKGTAGINYGLCVDISLLAIVVLLELEDGLVLQIINPNLLRIIFKLSHY